MSSKLFLGQASNYSPSDVVEHVFAIGSRKWSDILRQYLAKKYGTHPDMVYLMSNGRSAIAAGLKLMFPEGAEVIINGFTCYAVLQAVKRAGCTPVYADINQKTLNFDINTLEDAIKKHPKAKAIIIQNTLGITVDIAKIEQFAREHQLKIVEDLAHCAGFKYADGREVGSVGSVAALSFGKGKSLDAISGGALVVNDPSLPTFRFQNSVPRLSDTIRARFYPLLGAIGRGFSKIHLEKYWYGPLIRLKFIERAVDARLDLTHRPAHWQAKRVYEQFKKIEANGALPIRTHFLVKDRTEVLTLLDKKGFNFREIWYDVPVSPVRYYQKINFPEQECPTSTFVSQHIVNVPTYYPSADLKPALKIIEEHEL